MPMQFQTLRPAGSSQVVSIGSSSTQSSAMPNYISEIKLAASSDCYVEFGASPTATATSMFLAGDKIDRYFHFKQGDKIAVLQVSGAGSLYVTPMTR